MNSSTTPSANGASGNGAFANSASGNGDGRAAHTDEERLRRLLAVPYVAVFHSAPNEAGEWVRRAEYPELPGCAVEAPSAVEAMDRLERLRIDMIVAAFTEGRELPTPRGPLRGGTSGLSAETARALARRAIGTGAVPSVDGP